MYVCTMYIHYPIHEDEDQHILLKEKFQKFAEQKTGEIPFK